MKPLLLVLFASAYACSTAYPGAAGVTRMGRSVVRVTGSDTMVNLLQAWAERYKSVRPDVVVQVAGGGSGVGIAGLIDGTLDVAAASREIRADERERARARYGTDPVRLTVALDALAIYVHPTNPITMIAITDLAEIYGEGGTLQQWSQLAASHPACASGRIIRVGRQNNSGTFAYFREVVLGRAREYQMGSIDQSGSKDVVALVSRTPCAIGYSGLAYASAAVKTLALATARGTAGVAPAEATVLDHSYSLARPLYVYTAGPPDGHVRDFLRWATGGPGQEIVRELGFVIPPATGADREE